MQKLVHSLTMLLVLYHTLVGCCWHHAHAHSLESGDAPPVAKSCCGHTHHEHRDQHQPAEHSQHHDSDCEHGKCVFFMPLTDGGAKPLHEVSSIDQLGSDLPHQDLPQPSWETSESPPPGGLPPLRLHLVNQILLI